MENQRPKQPHPKNRRISIFGPSTDQCPVASLLFRYSPKVASNDTFRKPIKYGCADVISLKPSGNAKTAIYRRPKKYVNPTKSAIFLMVYKLFSNLREPLINMAQ
ncbi:MAG: hypothetical protein CVV64_11570 [Candidatus Wallbacteria bacterium HGW-Wallbacteria-1]|uniref:Uncharacterized protein n=1 Tax=Candidatus Wallbacteria bacterium HGW-Wallbacteria-1 TaxID=2013854 RepID=A0A2N1PNR6_9BACT|nr:MAG: hypothetical protein CVV64_11570 [Candidatus Wallbacteria bacterium HGW-Wallbacteria-1]